MPRVVRGLGPILFVTGDAIAGQGVIERYFVPGLGRMALIALRLVVVSRNCILMAGKAVVIPMTLHAPAGRVRRWCILRMA